MRAAAAADVLGVSVEHAGIVGLAIFREDLDDLRIGLEAERLQTVGDHLEATVRHDRALQRRIRLQPDYNLVLLVDVTRIMGGNRTRYLRDVEDPLLALLDEQIGELLPDCGGPLRRSG